MTDAALSDDEIREFRRAARAIVRAEHRSRSDRLLALMQLAEAVRQSSVADLAQPAIWAESKAFIRGEFEEPLGPVNNPGEVAIRGLIRRQYVSCPTCRRSLPTEQELDDRRRGRIAELEERRLFEEAGA